MSAPPSPWPYIASLLGHSQPWMRDAATLRQAIERAEKEGRQDAAEHLRIMLERQRAVAFDGS